MAVKPTETIQWANNDIEEVKTINGSLETLPNKKAPPQEFLDSGILYREPLARPFLNWFLNLTARYINYIEERMDEFEATLVRDSIVAAAAKTTLVDADSFGVVDSEASNVLKEVTFGNLRASFPAPSTTVRTTLEQATNAEAIAGIDTDRAVSPAALKAALDNLLANHLPSGTTTVFYQQNAPTGWTKSTSVNDRVLHITSGSDGGTNGGSWTVSGLTVDGHTLTVAEMPSHRHEEGLVARGSAVGGSTFEFGTAETGITANVNEHHQLQNTGKRGRTSLEGDGDPHTHGLSSAGSWRPAHAKFILCVKD